MRLIDADKLPTDDYKYIHRHTIITAPTIEAITVDWLRERASRMLDFGEGIERIIQEWQDEQSK